MLGAGGATATHPAARSEMAPRPRRYRSISPTPFLPRHRRRDRSESRGKLSWDQGAQLESCWRLVQVVRLPQREVFEGLELESVRVLAAQQVGAPSERRRHQQNAERVHRAADRLRLAQQAEVAEHVDKVVRAGVAGA